MTVHALLRMREAQRLLIGGRPDAGLASAASANEGIRYL
jgi:hypothetical protein